MADKEKTEYSPEDSQEIDRILDILPGGNNEITFESHKVYESKIDTEESPEEPGEIPEDLDIPEFQLPAEDLMSLDTPEEEIAEPLDEILPEFHGDNDLDPFSDQLAQPEEDLPVDIPEELADPVEEEPESIEDVTSLLKDLESDGGEEPSLDMEDSMIPEEEPEPEPLDPDMDIPDFGDELPPLEEDSGSVMDDLGDFTDLDPADEFSEEDEPASEELPDLDTNEPEPEATEEISEAEPIEEADLSDKPIEDQLNSILADEPDSVDIQDISDNAFVDDDVEEELPSVETETAEEPMEGLSLEGDDSEDMPDLSDISADESTSFEEADVTDIPDIDLNEISVDTPFDDAISDGADANMEEETPPIVNSFEDAIEEGSSTEMDDLSLGDDISDGIDPLESGDPGDGSDDLSTFDDSPMEEDTDSLSLDDMSDDDHAMGMDTDDDMAAPSFDDDLGDLGEIEPLDDMDYPDDIPDMDDYPDDEMDDDYDQERGGEPLELSDEELERLKGAILEYPSVLTNIIKDTIVNDTLGANDTRILVEMILKGRPEENIHRFLEKKLKRKIDLNQEEVTSNGRKVLVSRPEYTQEGRQRQKDLVRKTKIFGAVALVTVALTIAGYNLLYKPFMAKRLIKEGVKYIMDVSENKLSDFEKAEENFKIVDRDYIHNYMDGYRKYGEAYFKVKRYGRSLSKYNKAYDIDPVDKDLLLDIGNYYAKVPESFYNNIKSKVDDYYYKKVPKLETIEKSIKSGSKESVAMDFYKKVLNIDKHSTDAMVGIGNLYFNNGQYLKAKNYYSDILKVDGESLVGHSAILNFYIERDNFPDYLSAFVEVRERELLESLPSALLCKMSYYFLSKAKTDKINIRVDYGIQSPNIVDDSDNPYPAVRYVLKALHNKDGKYPPLYLHFAKLEQKRGELKLMHSYITKAVKTSMERGEEYYGALHLMGEYYTRIKDPVKAYAYLERALKARLNPPLYTYDEYYVETEHPGKTHAEMGNIFYYFFDKVKYRFGDNKLESGEGEKAEADKFANYEIAMKRYESALKLDYKSPELYYNLGRIYYMKGMYERSINQWLNLYDDFTGSPELMMSLGNAFYHMNNYENSKSQYLKVIDYFEFKADRIKEVVATRNTHVKIFNTLGTAYNNLGAVYQQQRDEVNSNISYWKSVDYAKRVNQENEFARVNLGRSLKTRKDPITPLLDENIPFSIDVYREDMR